MHQLPIQHIANFHIILKIKMVQALNPNKILLLTQQQVNFKY